MFKFNLIFVSMIISLTFSMFALAQNEAKVQIGVEAQVKTGANVKSDTEVKTGTQVETGAVKTDASANQSKTEATEEAGSVDSSAAIGQAQTETSAANKLVFENTLTMCTDKKDNDADNHVDCADQDCSIFAVCVSAQKPPQKDVSDVDPEKVITRPVSLGFVPGLTTDSGSTFKVRNNFALNFIGMGDYLEGVELSFIGAIRRNDVRGVQGSGVFNASLGQFKGVQGAGVANISTGPFSGLQASGLTNIATDSVTGLQGAGIFNLSDDFKGVQGAGIANGSTGNFKGIQGSGLGNYNDKNFAGIQGTGVANFNGGYFVGLQGAGVANMTTGNFRGLQGAGVANVTTGHFKGLQAAGVANVTAGQFTGAQIGLINVGTKVHGTQIGLINIASKEMKGAPIGLINFAGDGMLAPTFWMSDAGMLNGGIKMGSKHVYSILGAGAHPAGDERVSITAGLGGHIDFSNRFWLEIDLLHSALHDNNEDWDDDTVDYLQQFRVNVGFRLGDQFSLYAGPSLNVLVSEEKREVGILPTMYNGTESDKHVAVSPGLTFGFQWEPKLKNLNRLPY